ncbi:hypothetical protein ACIP98_31950 [Streptomyces sp. NPDC088354]|uniref:hypothetical protein n=1 Tax=Streptomyces sp. NPDC088354 TaxID=3365856 RepID=UPI003801E5C8
MYHMSPEHVATEIGTRQLWHAVDCNGNTLCGQALSEKALHTPGVTPEDYCTTCMRAVGAAMASHTRQTHVASTGEGVLDDH